MLKCYARVYGNDGFVNHRLGNIDIGFLKENGIQPYLEYQ